jgi:hypothetical protein
MDILLVGFENTMDIISSGMDILVLVRLSKYNGHSLVVQYQKFVDRITFLWASLIQGKVKVSHHTLTGRNCIFSCMYKS